MKLAKNEACKMKADVEDVNEPESIHKVTLRSKLCYRYGKIHHFYFQILVFIITVNVTNVMKCNICIKCV